MFWRRKKNAPLPTPEAFGLVASDEQIRLIAKEVVTGMLKETRASGHDPAEISGGAIAIFLNTTGAEIYSKDAQKLWDKGIREKHYYSLLAENINRVRTEIVKLLAENGFSVGNLLAQEAEWSRQEG